nr:MAG TPA: Kallikrein-7 [Caudoviricetes sp.]
MTNAQCVSGKENPNVEDIAVGMIIAKVATDFHIEVDAERYIPHYHQMKGWLLSEKEK